MWRHGCVGCAIVHPQGTLGHWRLKQGPTQAEGKGRDSHYRTHACVLRVENNLHMSETVYTLFQRVKLFMSSNRKWLSQNILILSPCPTGNEDYKPNTADILHGTSPTHHGPAQYTTAAHPLLWLVLETKVSDVTVCDSQRGHFHFTTALLLEKSLHVTN